MAVGWYLRFSLAYRDVEDLLQERGMSADHVTVWRWVQRYAPGLDPRLRPHLKPTNKSWRVEPTYIRVKGKWAYLYRAVESAGASIDFLLSGFFSRRPLGADPQLGRHSAALGYGHGARDAACRRRT
jgi:transposase, IS6 family